MFGPASVVVAIVVYMAALFVLAQWSERSAAGRKLSAHPVVYALGLAVYCTTWTYYGSVGKASTGGMGFIPVYLGPTVAMLIGSSVFRRMARLKKAHHITSIADFVSARYGKSQSVAALVTVILMIGIVPYVGLQLKAVTGTFRVLTTTVSGEHTALSSWISPLAAALMTVFTIAFGIRHLDPTERHPGMVTSLAAESLIKLTAFVAAGVYVVASAFGDMGGFVEHLRTADISLPMMGKGDTNQTLVWLTVSVLSMSAFAFLPRQFHVGVIENSSEKSIKTAMWLTPLYLIAINIFVVPIAMGGMKIAAPGTTGDQYVLALPVQGGNAALSLAVFVGGFSAAIGMIMIEGMTTATMISNHLLMPLFRKVPSLAFLQRRMLFVRWVAAAAFIGAGYGFEVGVGDSYMLVAIGLVSFAAAFLVAPVLLGGLFWREASRGGALLGLGTGFITWSFTLLLPTFIKSGWLSKELLTEGLFGVRALRPEALLGMEGLPGLTHGVLWSFGVCVTGYLVGSVIWAPDKEERRLTDDFLDEGRVLAHSSGQAATIEVQPVRETTAGLLGRFFEEREIQPLVNKCFASAGCANGAEKISVVQHADLHHRVEKTLAGAIGAATAHAIMKEWGTVARNDTKALVREYARMMANMRLSPKEIKERIDFQEEREGLLNEQFRELSKKIEERDAEIVERQKAEQKLQEAHNLLEDRVVERTAELAQRTRDMRMVLDNVQQGFITIDPSGVMSPEMSAIVATWLGSPEGIDNICEYLGAFDSKTVAQLEMGLEAVVDDVLPLALCLAQLPTRYTNGKRTLEARYQEVLGDSGELSKILVVLSDITEQLKHRETEERQREVLRMFDCVLRDRLGFVEFLAEARQLVRSITTPGTASDRTKLAREVHTLKGNAGVFGLASISGLCHSMEERISEEGDLNPEHIEALKARWAELEKTLRAILGDGNDRTIQITDQEYKNLLQAVLDGVEGQKLLSIIADWKREETAVRLQRLAAQARGIARRLGKPEPHFQMSSNGVRLKPERWTTFWASLVHVLRNCLDHGLEAEEDRMKVGKDGRGTLFLTTEINNDRLCIEVGDDGAGIDWDRIRAKAKEKGLSVASQEELESALFEDGLSTRDSATEYSGRGVGMSVVKAECEQRGGRIQIISEKGKGTRFRFIFPRPRHSIPARAA